MEAAAAAADGVALEAGAGTGCAVGGAAAGRRHGDREIVEGDGYGFGIECGSRGQIGLSARVPTGGGS